MELPAQEQIAVAGQGEAIDADVQALIDSAHMGAGGKSVAPGDRAFSKDRNLAAAAGRVGGEKKPAHLVDGK